MILAPKRLAQSKADIEEGKFVLQDPSNVAPITVWLCSPANTWVTGRIFSQSGSRLTAFSTFHPTEGAEISKGKAKWEVSELSEVRIAFALGGFGAAFGVMLGRASRADFRRSISGAAAGDGRADADGRRADWYAQPADGEGRAPVISAGAAAFINGACSGWHNAPHQPAARVLRAKNRHGEVPHRTSLDVSP